MVLLTLDVKWHRRSSAANGVCSRRGITAGAAEDATESFRISWARCWRCFRGIRCRNAALTRKGRRAAVVARIGDMASLAFGAGAVNISFGAIASSWHKRETWFCAD